MTYINQDGIRIDELGHETQFIICDDLIDAAALAEFNQMLYSMALGFTVIDGQGGWKGQLENISIYRVASLSNIQRMELVTYLLNNSRMTDFYVVLPGGMAVGYSKHKEVYRNEPQEWHHWSAERHTQNKLHGTRNTGWPHK